jgi:RNA polymerase sigma factor (sigma-70 family)
MRKRRSAGKPVARRHPPSAPAPPATPPQGPHAVDATLVARCLQGDGSAWQLLLTRHRPLVLAVARRNGLRADEAEDIFQSVCVTMLERLDLLRDHGSLAAWVATTTARKCWRRTRGQAAERNAARAEDPPGPAPEEEFVLASERAAVQEALRRLAEPCGRLLHRMFVDGDSYRKLARELGLAVGSIGVYRRRCLARLRAELEATGWLRPGGGAHEEA